MSDSYAKLDKDDEERGGICSQIAKPQHKADLRKFHAHARMCVCTGRRLPPYDHRGVAGGGLEACWRQAHLPLRTHSHVVWHVCLFASACTLRHLRRPFVNPRPVLVQSCVSPS